MPNPPTRAYNCEMWEPNWLTESWGRFRYAVSYPDSFILSCSVGTSEPEIGYPYHYGNVTGINDTIKVRVYFNNKSSADLIMSGINPETWFYPVLYNPYANVFEEDEIADTSLFDYEFAYWTIMLEHSIISTPDTIFSSLLNKNKPHYRMIYNLWGVPAGTFRVVLEPTASLPSNIQIEVDNPNYTFNRWRMRNPNVSKYFRQF